MIAQVVDVAFTRGSPFGEQWWTFKTAEGKTLRFAMWLDCRGLWPKTGEWVELQDIGPRKCYTGGGGSITCEPCARLIQILEDIPCPS